MTSGRTRCPACEAAVLVVFVAGRPTTLDWPHALHGEYAVEHTRADSWLGRYLPVGEPVSAVEKRFRIHLCGEPIYDRSEPVRTPAVA